ncbi:MAG: restriction endonuclease subunit S [Chlorobium sp.]|uniref:restriction endonuclease subunit S n=1 Tax=Chlorobium sp. TaxID=1095 RepID=UPI0025BCA47A|nr:restriction endonuclease subunit S [Chlorobium sp.]MCF8217188.1 restriction endonuclease subunit S [Chlorobium sp.]MCF8272035.1 restriction endonuclease subunit S [Chlorobium sp.]MCF8288406.1 restriction endonuclease subunit S [Chlorobium sp.]MCF8292005.1 restriction endonuclease subunit S [Chlorobium sp.]MCF8386109.1 restriction endonuclease subunit S [Chlorobium sp.]
MSVPIDWKEKTLGEFVSLQRGYDLPNHIRENGEIPVVGGGGPNGYHSEAKAIGPGVVIGRSGAGFGTAFYVKENYWPHNTGLFVTDFKGNDPLFVFHLLDALDFSSYNSGGAQPSLNRNFIYPIPISCPALPEQKAIAELISTWDEAIEKTERLIQAKERRFKWLLRELISEQINREKETGWKKVRIGSFLTESWIQDRDNDPKKRLSVRLHLKGVEVREYRGTESDGATAYFIRKAGQFIYGKQNIFKGAVGIVPRELDGYSSTQDIPAFDVADHVDKHWLLFLFSYSNFYKKLELYASGSGSKRLQPKELFRMKISLPPFEVQQKIAEALFFAQHEIDLLKQLAEQYKTQKRGLMQKMLTGEWRVKLDVVKRYA